MLVRLLSRRSARRSIIFISITTFVVFWAGYLEDFIFYTLNPPKVDIQTIHEPGATVTRIRTAWALTTRTVMAEPTGSEQLGRREGRPLPQHIYRSDGLLEVNPDGPHPIYELIQNAEAEWDAKVARSSKTLKAAVVEYKRRYQRSPPLGFDDWWRYVEENNVQLPDEYDQIYEDLEPYWGMDPNDLQDIVREWEAHEDSYTIGKAMDGLIGLANYSLGPGNDHIQKEITIGVSHITDLLEDVEEFIPPFRAVFSPHDNPNLHTDFELRSQALRHAAAGTFLDINAPPEVKLQGWPSACAASSPAQKIPFDPKAEAPLQHTKTFIHKHRAAMDPCLHPSLLLQHGQFLAHHFGPVPHRKMVPQFSYSSTMMHHDITTAMPINWVDDITPRTDDPEWEHKVDERLQWRGSNTGIWHAPHMRWRDAQRVRLMEWATKGYGTNVTVLPATQDALERVGPGAQVRKARYGPAMLDIAFAGQPLSCEAETCDKLKQLFEYRPPQDMKAAGNYKYILDVDGHGWSSRFKRLMTSNSLIFKSTVFPEWYTNRIAPWVHYIPVQVDLSDAFDILTFFRGNGIDGDNSHDDLARKIALAGRHWSRTYWRREDLTAYMFRLFLEYARVMDPERLTMSYYHPDT